jgi:cyclophilin family peptidyl-prolyl cis-trans isomerase
MRALAAVTAGRLGGDAHAAALRALTSDPDEDVAATALFAVAMRHDQASLPRGFAALRGSPLLAARGAWLLGELGESARAAIVTALGDSTLPATARDPLLLAAARMRPVPTAARAPWVASPDSATAWRAAYALARGRSAGGVRSLIAVATSPWAAVRAQAARGLARSAAGDSLRVPALAALRELARDAESRVRVNALRSLASYGADAQRDLLAALHDMDPAVRLAAAQVATPAFGTDRAAWVHALAADTVFVVQRTLLAGAVPQQVGISLVDAWRSSGDWRYRSAAVELGSTGAATVALPRLEGWTHDGDPRVRATAVEGIARLADTAEVRARARHALTVQLTDEDVIVRAAALAGLAHGATMDDLMRSASSYAKTRDERELDARLAFWNLADSALRRGESMPDRLDRALVALPRPSDPLERAAAARIPRFAAWHDETSAPRPLAWYRARAREAAEPVPPSAVVETERGSLVLDLFGSAAPLTVYNFVHLARAGWFDGQRFHRVVPDFVVQGGDPRGDGNGGPGYAIRDEINPHRYERGTVGMALSGPNTGGSQFFITHSPQPHLDGGYTVFGQLRTGADVLDHIVQGDRIVRITIR